MNDSQFNKFLQVRRKRIDKLLCRYLSSITRGGPKELGDAMRYVVLGGGKRLRSLLIYAVGEKYSAPLKSLDPLASAIELIHAFSLVHDDLPAMDNDRLRRGQPTCHIIFDEATAILAGDSLAIAAFQILNESKNISAEKKAAMNKVLAIAAGPKGLAGGQYLDLHPGDKNDQKNLEKIYLLKTGALISAAIKLGALASEVNKRKLALWYRFSRNIGLAFQIQDDILNIEGDATKLGKNIGTDSNQNKITYPALVGIKAAKIKIEKLAVNAQKILRQLKIKDGALPKLTEYIMRREF